MTQTSRRNRYLTYGAGALAIIVAIIVLLARGIDPVCPPGPRPTYDLLALSSLSDLSTAQQLAPTATQQVAARAANGCAIVRVGIATGGSVANLKITPVNAVAPNGTAAKRGPVVAQYQRELASSLKAFIVQLDHTTATPGSPVYGTIRRAIEDYENVSGRASGPLIIVLITDGLAVEATDDGEMINLEAPRVDISAVQQMSNELATTVKQARTSVSVLIVGFGANAPFGDPRIDRAEAILTQSLHQAGIRFRWSRSQVPADPGADS
jgi:hypothetical protein